ncbi:hypothetical protein OMO38_08550 [Chryseobacterium sp. 09-1422]|uniref:Uncharacterized protein n=1 Tax=Chryseobacterium kimseyorum TaxID=2984028 RepID=A0ABT3HXR8_9FLAO|nr:hypothetical protein [Chryseobacterium kimseyorum]MCW3168576.1 hypothetical protein [Chryseobacterium kimseyorum]
MKKISLFFILISAVCFAQQQNITVNDLKPKTENFNFPTVSIDSKPLVARKINTFLQVNELEFIPGSGADPSHLALTATNSYRNYVYFYEWKKLETPKNILSLKIDGEATGAYPEGFTDYKNFDLRTGNYINIEDLFNTISIKSVEKTVNQNVADKIQNFLNELKANQDDEPEKKEQIRMYEECLQFVQDGRLSYTKFYFGKEELTIVRERCSNHALLALDDLGSYEIKLPYQDIQQYLSVYGKNLLSKSEKAVTQNSVQNKLFKGKIDGKYPITVLINSINEDDSFSASYWYDKNKKLINWRGEFVHDHFSITEDDYHSEELKQWIPRAFVEADLKGNKIIGTWQDYKTKKYLNLELEEL